MSNFNNGDLDRKLKKIVNDINIEVPENLRKNVLDNLEKLPNRDIKGNRNYKKAAGFIGILVIGLLAFNTFMPVYAEGLPVIGPTFKSINEAIGFGGKYEDKAKDINLSKKYKDTTMTIKNIYYDGIELAIAYEIKSENGFDKNPVILPIITRGIQDINYHNESSKGEFADDNTYIGVASYVFEDKQLPDKTNINFLVNDIYGDWVGIHPKKFNFKLKLDSENTEKINYKIDKEFEYDDSIFKVMNLDVSPFNTIIHYYMDTELIKYKDGDEKDIYSGKHNIRFMAIDDKGMPISFISGSSLGYNVKDSRVKGSGFWRFTGSMSDIKAITIIPVIAPINKYSQWDSNDKSKNYTINKLNKDIETIIKLDNDQEYIIKNIEFKEDKTIVNVKVKKYLSRIENTELSFWDQENSEIKIENTEFNGIDNGYDFTLTLPKLDSSKEYFVPIMKYNETVILKDEIMTIDISNKDKTKK